MTLTLPKAIKRLSYMLVHDRQKRNAVIIVTFCFMCVATALAVVSYVFLSWKYKLFEGAWVCSAPIMRISTKQTFHLP